MCDICYPSNEGVVNSASANFVLTNGQAVTVRNQDGEPVWVGTLAEPKAD